MYSILLTTHSWFRWLVLVALVFALYRAYRGWLGNKPFSAFEDKTRHISATIVHIQFMLGLALYFFSPIVSYFLNNFSAALEQRDIRFFGMEHITMMFIAVSVISMGSMRAKKKEGDLAKFRCIAIWYSVGLLIIFLSIPWEFSPFTSRPYFRSF
jgi:hypothetical protein